MSNIEEIKSKIDIVSLVGSYIKLEKAGSNFKGRCPFHTEKTPSFFVSPDRRSYYCFGCQAKGDIFSFVQEFEGLDFVGALKVLAEKAGVVLDYSNRGEKSEKERLFGVMEQATFFFQKTLEASPEAKKYLHDRGVNEKTIKEFRIGFVKDEWRTLRDYLLSKKVAESDILAVGLVKKKEGTTNCYDTFRGRIMFPICDSSGRVVAFSGRILATSATPTQVDAPKYLNSPETPPFSKSEILFGLDKAKKNIRLKGYSILVEGQMDLVMLHQAGFTNTVASSGTALTSDHLIKLRRLSEHLIMAYDGDSAGFNASNKGAKLVLSLGMELKVVSLPEGKDPADLAKDDPDELKKRIKNSKHIIDFYVDNLLERKMDSRELGQEIKKNVLPYVVILPSAIEKDNFIKIIAKKTFIKEDSIWDDLKSINIDSRKDLPYNNKSVNTLKRLDFIERKLTGLLFWQKTAQNPIVDILELKEKFRNIVGKDMDELALKFEKDREQMVFESENFYSAKDDLDKDISEMLGALEEEYLKKKFAETMILLQKAEQLRDSAEILRLLEECQNISQKINIIHEKN